MYVDNFDGRTGGTSGNINRKEVQKMIDKAVQSPVQGKIDAAVATHQHEGVLSQRIKFEDIEFHTDVINVQSDTIATTGNTDTYFIAPSALGTIKVDFSGTTALATSDTNYITWTITNLGQDGTGTAAWLATGDGINTTKSTGGSALAADTIESLTLTTTIEDLQVNEGDRIRIRAAVTNAPDETLANTVTFPVYLIQLTP